MNPALVEFLKESVTKLQALVALPKIDAAAIKNQLAVVTALAEKLEPEVPQVAGGSVGKVVEAPSAPTWIAEHSGIPRDPFEGPGGDLIL